MVRNLKTLVLCGIAGSMVMVGNAEACHKKKCGCAPTVCAAPAPAPVAYCAPKVKHCGFKLPTFCHKKPIYQTPVASCAPAPVYSSYPAPVAYAEPVSYAAPVSYSAPVSYPVPSYPTATPQATMQH